MRRMKQTVRANGALTALAFIAALFGSVADAADKSIPGYQIDDKVEAYKIERFPPAQYKSEITAAYDWVGPYFGIYASGEIGKSVWQGAALPATNVSLSGAAVGAAFGYNFQFGPWVAGVDADIDWMNARGSAACPTIGVCETRSSWFGTTRGRVGYAFDRILPYATAGFAFGQISADGTTPAFSTMSTKFGYAAGVGLEYAIHGPWTGRIEYLYVNLSKLNCPLCNNPVGPFSVDYSMNLLRLGLNYKY